jgi:acyl-CoA reductase-like NAD-dependent aldehyde dehydrogenase
MCVLISCRGVVLLVSPWNYPLNLAIVPLAGAIAAGNVAFVKLSRHSPHTSQCLASVLRRTLDPEAFCVDWQGGAEFLTALLAQRWDHVFFTGSVEVGKVVATAAARQLASATLELGGKNPVVVAADANIDLAAKRIVWGKFFNGGQTCIAPDHVLLVRGEGRTEAFAEAFRKYVRQFYGENPQQSASYSRVIHKAAFQRLAGLLREGRVLAGGQSDAADLFIAPTLIQVEMADVDRLELMRAEVFGPILPLIEVASVEEAVRFLQTRDLPLALHAFSSSKATLRDIFARTRSGSALGNDAALMMFANGRLPFGGVGASGVGSYHGERTFRALSNERATVYSSSSSVLDAAVHVFVYPPYRDWTTTLAEWLIWSGL